jgi:Concanavalin A-like lectin/glucanases superfamily
MRKKIAKVVIVFSSLALTLSAVAESVAKYDFNKIKDNTVVNESGKDGIGTIKGCKIVEGRKANTKALQFNGNASSVICSNNPKLNAISQAITVMCWIKYKGGYYPRIIDRYPAPSIYVAQKSNGIGWYGKIGTKNQDFTITGKAVKKNEWIHIAVSYSNDEKHQIKLYVNGKLLKTSSNAKGEIAANNLPLVIGNRKAGGRGLKGAIQSLTIDDTALSAEKIAEVFNKEK